MRIRNEITAHRVAARIAGITIHNLPFSQSYDHQEGIDSGDLYSYQIDYLPIEAQVLLAEHQLIKAQSNIRAWQSQESGNGINKTVGINDRERYRIFKNAPAFVGSQMNAAIKVLERMDPVIGAAWRHRNSMFYSNVKRIEHLCPSATGCYKKRMDLLNPILIAYLDDINKFIEVLIYQIYQ